MMSILLKVIIGLVKWTVIVIVTLLLLLSIYFGFQAIKQPEYLTAFPTTSSAFRAKEICSCLFVEKQREAVCEKYPPGLVTSLSDGHLIDRENRRVTSTGLGRHSTAYFVSERYGCILEKE
ncbi:MAG: amidase [Pseudomonadota bacterium]